MILAVEAGGYVEAADGFRTGNLSAAATHDTLLARLRACGAMAGDDASAAEFATAYDAAAREAVAAIGDVVAAYAGLGRLTEQSLVNHRTAEARSILPGGVVAGSCVPVPDASYRAVLPASLPTSLGGEPPALAPQEAWVLDHIEGFVWPDADVDRLRDAARAWRVAGEGLDDAATYAGMAAAALEGQRSPEIPLAVAAAADLRATVRDLVASCADLAAQCDAYADAVEARHAEIRALVGEILRFVVEGMVLGALLGGLTAGTGAAVGIGAVVARVSAQSPRFAAILGALRATTSGIAGSLRTTRGAVVVQRARLERFLRVPARNEAGHLVLGPARWQPGWLARHEHSGSHTLSRHVGKSVAELRERVRRFDLDAASSFRSQDDAERIIEGVVRRRSDDIADWLRSGPRRLTLDEASASPTGITVIREGQTHVAHDVRVVLERDASMREGFRIVTSYPRPSGAA